MNCTCPKCQAKIEVELTSEVGEEGSTASCPACKTRFHLYRESFAARVNRKQGEISCASCGNELGPEVHCTSCGTPFPDYIVAASGRKRTSRKASTSIRFDFNIFPNRKTAIVVPSLSMSQEERPGAKRAPKSGKKDLALNRTIAVTVVAVLALALGGGAFYLKRKTESLYMRNFAVACYAIQTGADKSRKICQKVSSEWKSKLDSGQRFVQRVNPDDDREMAAITSKLDRVKLRLDKEPEKFSDCNQKLAKLESAFKKLRTLSTSPGNSLPDFNNTVSQADAQYKQAATELKSGLPKELMDEIRSSAMKYRGLRPLLQEG